MPAAPTSAHRAMQHEEPNTTSIPKDGLGVSFGVTPRQACPRPEGLERNLRSKTRWFTGFCNSHQVSHFATFFIDARAEISVAESRVDSFSIIAQGASGKPTATPSKTLLVFLDAFGAVGSFCVPCPLKQRSGSLAEPKLESMDDMFTVYFVLGSRQ